MQDTFRTEQHKAYVEYDKEHNTNLAEQIYPDK